MLLVFLLPLYAESLSNTIQKPQPTPVETTAVLLFYSEYIRIKLFDNLGNRTGAYGSAAFTDSESQTVFHSDGRDQLYFHGYMVARHNHLDALRQRNNARNVCRSEIELRSVIAEERFVTAALVFR